MDYFSALLTGYLVAFIGLLAPSMLNMTAAKTSIKQGKSAGIQFAVGASSMVFVQASIAVFFAKYLIANPAIITKLKTIAVFVLLGLSVFFFLQAKKEMKIQGKQKKGKPYLIGLAMSSLNMLAIPFYLAMATFGESKGWLTITMPNSAFYVIGAVLGSFSLFSIYAIFAVIIAEKAQFIAKNINYILSGLFIVLGIITAFQVFG